MQFTEHVDGKLQSASVGISYVSMDKPFETTTPGDNFFLYI